MGLLFVLPQVEQSKKWKKILAQLFIIVFNSIMKIKDIYFARKQLCRGVSTQADIINDTHTYKSKVGIHRKIFSLVKPVFMELSDDALLKKCLHGQTQNNNESLNGLIWKKCPKDVYVGRTTLEMGVDSAVINFNAGSSRIIDVMKEYGIQDGYYTNVFCCKKDEERIKECNRKHGEKGRSIT